MEVVPKEVAFAAANLDAFNRNRYRIEGSNAVLQLQHGWHHWTTDDGSPVFRVDHRTPNHFYFHSFSAGARRPLSTKSLLDLVRELALHVLRLTTGRLGLGPVHPTRGHAGR